MEIAIKWIDGKYPSFNIELSTTKGKDPFITIKGCSLREHNGKKFVGMPAKKLESGKYFNYVYASDDFQKAVMEKAEECQPSKPQKEESKSAASFDDDIPW